MTDQRSSEASDEQEPEQETGTKPVPTTDVERKVGDMGKGSHEETQGGRS